MEAALEAFEYSELAVEERCILQVLVLLCSMHPKKLIFRALVGAINGDLQAQNEIELADEDDLNLYRAKLRDINKILADIPE